MVPPYDQFCPVAVSLDVLGEPWTILLLRDLLWSGPQRRELLSERNPGLTDDELTDRIATLTAHGLLAELDEPKRRLVLTESGQRIGGVIGALYEFGIPIIMDSEISDPMLAYAVADLGRRHRFSLLDVPRSVTVRLSVDEACVGVEIGPGMLRAVECVEADATISCTSPTLATVLGGALTYNDAVANGEVTVTGDPEAAAILGDYLRANNS